jgi:hypothetical protein
LSVNGVDVTIHTSQFLYDQEFALYLELTTPLARRIHLGARYSGQETSRMRFAHVQAWSRALSQTEIAQVAADPYDYASLASSPLIAHYPLTRGLAEASGAAGKSDVEVIGIASQITFNRAGWAPMG